MTTTPVTETAQAQPKNVKERRIFLVLPAYNEEAGLPPLLEAYVDVMTEYGLNYEVVVVDDGSSDRTAEVCRGIAEQIPLTLVQHEKNSGLAAAIDSGLRKGAELADPEDMIVTMDADNTHPPKLIPGMLEKIDAGADIVVASRYRKGAEVYGVPGYRNTLSLGASWLFRLMFPTRNLRDYTCGYRVYRASLIQEAYAHFGDDLVNASGFSCMVDLVIKLRKLKPKFAEVPILLRYDWKVGPSKMKVAGNVFTTLKLAFRRRLGFMS